MYDGLMSHALEEWTFLSTFQQTGGLTKCENTGTDLSLPSWNMDQLSYQTKFHTIH